MQVRRGLGWETRDTLQRDHTALLKAGSQTRVMPKHEVSLMQKQGFTQ